MKIIIACDSFKGSATTFQINDWIEKGIHSVFPKAQCVKIPVADGGEGTTRALVSLCGGKLYTKDVLCPMGNIIKGEYGILPNKTAVIEIASATGLTLVPKNLLNPLVATSFGTGQLILEAISKGCKKIILGLGGSATNDGGLGLMRALGARFYDEEKNEIITPNRLDLLDSIDFDGVDERVKAMSIILATDVKNPLCGITGATYIYGPQKGVRCNMLEKLDDCMAGLERVLCKKMGKSFKDIPGIGAAGGAGVMLYALGMAKIQSGIETLLDMAGFNEKLRGASLVITGEGRIDSQSIFGKVPVGVAKRAKLFDLPVVAIVGGMGNGAEKVYDHGVDLIFPITNGPMPLEQAVKSCEHLVVQAANRLGKTMEISKKIDWEKE